MGKWWSNVSVHRFFVKSRAGGRFRSWSCIACEVRVYVYVDREEGR